MPCKMTLLASALALGSVVGTQARADVVYTVFNPAVSPVFTLFVYDSPTFITADTLVPLSQLAFANPANTITSVELLPSSSTNPGTSEIDVFQSAGSEQQRYYPQSTFTQYGVTPGNMGSFGYPNSELSVAAPEPAALPLLVVGVLGLIGLRRSKRRAPTYTSAIDFGASDPDAPPPG